MEYTTDAAMWALCSRSGMPVMTPAVFNASNGAGIHLANSVIAAAKPDHQSTTRPWGSHPPRDRLCV